MPDGEKSKVDDKNKDERVYNYVYKYKIKDKNGKEHITTKKVTRTYIPVGNKKIKSFVDDAIEMDKKLNQMRKMFARCIQFTERNINNTITTNNRKQKPDMVVEEIVYHIQQINAVNVIIKLIEYLKEDKPIYFKLREKRPKLVKEFESYVKEYYDIDINEVIK